ncbi:hypothetical protein K7432_018592 [Basidiobolus ranarum]|uniref:Uncharacterized protein n=1 Tax=Basidiobolus ranarum TaxID=34480 RepID=A0ABR2VIU2_9FUNG
MHSFGARESQVNLEEPLPTFPNNHHFLHKTPHGQRVNSFKERPKSCPTFDRKPPKYFQDAHNQQPKTREKQK